MNIPYDAKRYVVLHKDQAHALFETDHPNALAGALEFLEQGACIVELYERRGKRRFAVWAVENGKAAAAEVAALRKALTDALVFEMLAPQSEFECTIMMSDGWACSGCEDAGGSGTWPDREDVVHRAGCPLAPAVGT